MKSKIFTNYIIATGFCLSLLFMGCSEKEEQQVAPNLGNQNSLKAFYQDSAYLKIEGDLYDPHIIWGEANTYLPAFKRFMQHSHLENNQIVLEFNSAEQINVSTNIFDYIKVAFERMNQKAVKDHLQLTKTEEAYIFAQKTKSDEPEHTSPFAKKLVLYVGEDVMNFYNLYLIAFRYWGNLSDFIDFAKSDMIYENRSITGKVDVFFYLGSELLQDIPPTIYFCHDAGDKDNEMNLIEYLPYQKWWTELRVSNSKLFPLIILTHPELAPELEGKGVASQAFY